MLYNFDFKSVIATIGPIILRGWADGDDVLTVEMESDLFSDVNGADGEVARSALNDFRGKLTAKLMQTSPTNDELSVLMNSDILLKTGVVPVLIKDGSGRTVIFSGHGWIMKPPNTVLGRAVGSRDWVIRMAQVNQFVGGSPLVTSA